MKTRTDPRRIRFPAPHGDGGDEPIDLLFEEEEDVPSSEYVVMSQEREMSALREYLHDLREQNRVAAI